MNCIDCGQKIEKDDVICCKRNCLGRTYVRHNDCKKPKGYVELKTYKEKGVNPFFGAKMGLYSL